MANRKSSKPRERAQFAGDLANMGDFDSSMFFFGDLNSFGAFPFPTVPTIFQRPRAPIFYITRNWFERSVYIKTVILMRIALYNYGFTINAVNKSDQKKIDKWKDDEEGYGRTIRKYVQDAWQEWLVQDNCISIWRNNGIPICYPCEHSAYHDEFGIEHLSVTHSLTAEAIDKMPGLSAKEKRTLMDAPKSELQMVKQGNNYMSPRVFYFDVIKRTRVGNGLAWPQLRTLFNTVIAWESMEVGDWQLADVMRTVYELHQVGHEITSGPHAGSSAHFLKQKRAEAIRKLVKNKGKLLARVVQLIVNFDHAITQAAGRPDPKHLKADRYESFLQKFDLWSAPLGSLLFKGASDVNPAMTNFLKAQALYERGIVGPHIRDVLTLSLKPPGPIQISFGNDIFMDPRVMLEAAKAGMNAGPLSGASFLETAGYSPDVERSRKDEENNLPPHQILPPYDPAHGNQPGKGSPGRKVGGKDRQPRQKS